MKNLFLLIVLTCSTVFANNVDTHKNVLISKANNQAVALENVIKSYLNLDPNSIESKEVLLFNAEIFDENLEILFEQAENINKETLNLVGEQSNIWEELRQTLKLPPNKVNKLRIFNKARTLLAVNDKLINQSKGSIINYIS